MKLNCPECLWNHLPWLLWVLYMQYHGQYGATVIHQHWSHRVESNAHTYRLVWWHHSTQPWHHITCSSHLPCQTIIKVCSQLTLSISVLLCRVSLQFLVLLPYSINLNKNSGYETAALTVSPYWAEFPAKKLPLLPMREKLWMKVCWEDNSCLPVRPCVCVSVLSDLCTLSPDSSVTL